MLPVSAVIGYPAHHSRSPLIHGYWLRQFKLSGAYLRLTLPPDDFCSYIKTLQTHGLMGANITVPYKEMAFSCAQILTPSAQKLRAVNTLWHENGVLHGDNTDVYGFLANLDQAESGWDRHVKKAVVLGAGGAARAIVSGLQGRGITQIHIVNRTLARAQEIASDLGAHKSATPWSDLPEILRGADFLVNTTSLGMKGQPPLEVDISQLAPGALVTDIVYVPLKTQLLQQAEQHGYRTVDGLGMLLHQAVPGFERWFGVRPTVTDELRQLIISDLEHAT